MQAFIVAALLAVAVASPSGGNGGYGGYGGQSYSEPRAYRYSYAVDDPHYGPMMSKDEESDGYDNVRGYYSVHLPDGRVQHVRYDADHENGYVAEVTYDGYASHPNNYGRGYGYGGGH